MKKFLAILLAAMLVLSMTAVAFADDTKPEDMSTVTITKVYKLIGNGSSPAETFTMQVTNQEVVTGDATSAPDLGEIEGAVFAGGDASAEGATANITVHLPQYQHVGIYEYTLVEDSAAQTAGVSYYSSPILLRVTVVNDETGNIRIAAVHTESTTTEGALKSDRFTNTYSAGTLKVTKSVEGNLGDKSKYFEFKVTLTGVEGKNYAESFAVTGGSYNDNPTTIALGTETTFYLKHGDTLSIANLPYDVQYTVAESDYSGEGYTTTKSGDTGSISAAEQTASFTNSKTSDIDTGITVDSLPYVLLMGIVLLAGAAMIIKRRAHNN